MFQELARSRDRYVHFNLRAVDFDWEGKESHFLNLLSVRMKRNSAHEKEKSIYMVNMNSLQSCLRVFGRTSTFP